MNVIGVISEPFTREFRYVNSEHKSDCVNSALSLTEKARELMAQNPSATST